MIENERVFGKGIRGKIGMGYDHAGGWFVKFTFDFFGNASPKMYDMQKLSFQIPTSKLRKCIFENFTEIIKNQ